MTTTKNNILKEPVVVLADGVFPQHPFALQRLQEAGAIVCCDGAAEQLLAHGMEPHYIVGDLDSVSEATKQRFAERLHYDANQETNDLTKAVCFCEEQGVRRLTILGATGSREDHAIANISLLADYVERLQVEMITDYGVFTAIHQTTTFESVPGQQVSIFSLTPKTRVTLDGLEYPLHEALLDSWWKGSLNKALERRFTITIDEGRLIVFRVFFPNLMRRKAWDSRQD